MRRAPKNLKRITVIGFFITALSFVGLAYSKTMFFLLFSLAVLAFGIGFVNAYLPSLLSVYVEEKDRGKIMGVYEGVGSLSRVLGPIISYTIVFQFMRQGYLGYGVVLAILGVFFLLILRYKVVVNAEVQR